MLPAEFYAGHSVGTQQLPDNLLRTTACARKVSCSINSFFSYDPPLLASPPAPRAERNMKETGMKNLHRDHHPVVPGVGAAIEAVLVHADAMHRGEAEGVRAAHDRIALPLQLALDLPLDAVGDVYRV
jgi:hypothetical protein